MVYLEAHTELVAEAKLEHGILDFTPVHIPQDQTVSVHILRHSLHSKASGQVYTRITVHQIILEQMEY